MSSNFDVPVYSFFDEEDHAQWDRAEVSNDHPMRDASPMKRESTAQTEKVVDKDDSSVEEVEPLPSVNITPTRRHAPGKPVRVPLDPPDMLLYSLRQHGVTHENIAIQLEREFNIRYATGSISSRCIRIEQALRAAREKDARALSIQFTAEEDAALCEAYDRAHQLIEKNVTLLRNRIWDDTAERLHILLEADKFSAAACKRRYRELAREEAAARESTASEATPPTEHSERDDLPPVLTPLQSHSDMDGFPDGDE